MLIDTERHPYRTVLSNGRIVHLSCLEAAASQLVLTTDPSGRLPDREGRVEDNGGNIADFDECQRIHLNAIRAFRATLVQRWSAR